MSRADRDIADLLSELERTLSALRRELEPSRTPDGFPRMPPMAREVVSFTERYTIPALIAVLKANIRSLELGQQALQRAERGMDEAEPRDDGVGDGALDRLDDVLADLQRTALRDHPDDPEVRRLLSDARRLGADVREEVGAARARGWGRAERDPRPSERSRGVEINVEDELDSIRKEVTDEGHDDTEDA